MKYTQILDMNMVPEWRNQYLDYQDLDAALNKAIESKNMKARGKGVNLYFELVKFNQKFANFFSRECRAQLDKINKFHKEKLSEMKGKYNNLQDQLDQVLSSAIYREIQPDLSSCRYYEQEQDPHNYQSASFISDVFKNLKDSIGLRPAGDPQTIGCNQSTSRPRLLQPQVEGRLSVAAIFGDSNRRYSQIRLGRERVTQMARKLSSSFSNQAHRLSDNISSQLHRQQVVSSNPQINKHNETNHQNGNSKVGSLIQRLMRSERSDGNDDGDGNGDLEGQRARSEASEQQVDQQNYQTFAGAGPQSKRKIIASYKKKMSYLKFAFRELYFNLVLFEQYTQLNHNGFEQILRKHDRMFASTLGRKFYQEHVQTADFYSDLQAIDHLIESVEHVYTLHFENGNRRKAIEKLQVPTNVYRPSSPMLDFRVGYELGMFTVLFMLVILVGLISNTDYDWRTIFRLYRSPLMLIIFLFQTGISIVIWKHYKINHVLIFELNPRNNLSFQHFLEFGSILGVIWSISVLLFLFSGHLNIRPSICPLVVMILIALYLFNPTQTGHYQARFWLLRILVSIIMTLRNLLYRAKQINKSTLRPSAGT